MYPAKDMLRNVYIHKHNYFEKLKSVYADLRKLALFASWYRQKAKFNLSRVIRIPAFCICENKGADQPCSNGAAA